MKKATDFHDCDAIQRENVRLYEDIRRAARTRELVIALALLSDENNPNIEGKFLCWCVQRGPFARGPHDGRCVELRTLITDRTTTEEAK